MSSQSLGDERIRSLLAALLGAAEPFRIEVIPSHLYVCRKVMQGAEAFLLKIALASGPGEDLLRGVEAQRLAQARGARVAEVVAVSGGASASEHAFVLQRWVPGMTGTKALKTASPGELISIARSLGRNIALIHGALRERELDDRIQELRRGGWRAQCARRLAARAQACQNTGGLAAELGGTLARRCSRLIEECLEEVGIGLVHWDLHMDNVVIADAELAAVLDFDRAELGDPLVDFVKVDATLLMEHPAGLPPFLEAYSAVHPLGPSWDRRIFLYQGIEYLSALSQLHFFPDEAERYLRLTRRWLANERHRWQGLASA
ncbi:phosphotransferase family protein [Corallococcus carmarthensis]|uniref:Aminoglycoside phosphotransferase family protein n=1 Tax=Corallococcus carmarthensis TaxID=2316728 RepID=A0A3A8K5P5_9BACT|nr:aminoglycoside phosphotransferase family protein [Corallococcus carmarthensis]NOK18528.1 aminoglycoside phosphotransferase family protein [Corallococcus carmarthensis]RKG99470.1 aminoglycoside phosphotransferase family protein [Corallococcus carmarthensis]